MNAAPVYLTADIRRVEGAAAAHGGPPLMERAGLAAAELARELAGQTGRPVLVLAGPGNNGGDAFVVARRLKQWFFGVEVVFSGDESKLPHDAAAALAAWRAAGGKVAAALPDRRDWSLVVDGLFGIGLQRDIVGTHADIVARINAMSAPKLALDIPSGLESDTGRVLGCAVRSDHTITFIAMKPGLLTLDGPDCCGVLHLATLNVDAPALVPTAGALIGREALTDALPRRRRNTHKGTYGSVGILGGAHGMAGAALLAGRAALKLGAGRVYTGFLDRDAPRLDALQPELMLRAANEVLKLDHLTCLAAGPGLGRSPAAALLLRSALETALPLVLDADALNLIAADANAKTVLNHRDAPTLLTPHPAEAARLLDTGTDAVQRDRVAAARRLADAFHCGIALKGAGTVCAAPDGRWAINTSGNPGMAAAGMGDVLTGMVAALLSQGVAPQRALEAGVWMHGAAADAAVAAGCGPAGLTASEVTDFARKLLNAN